MGLIVYLMFNGDCEEALNFYVHATGGSIESIQRYGDSPMPSDDSVKGKVLHAVAKIHGATVMGSDTDGKRKMIFGDNVQLSLDFTSEEEINRVFEAISAGGTITMPLQDTFWNARFGMCTDRFGIHWMFNYDRPAS